MNQILFKNALEHYRNQEDLEEIELVKDKRYLFMDIDDGYIFPLNNIDEISIAELFVDLNSGENCNMTDINEFVNMKELEKIFKNINKKYFFFPSEILVLLNERDIYVAEEYLGRELLDGTLGQTTADTNSVVVNMVNIFDNAKNISYDKEEFFKTCVKEFYITLLHELGHISLRDNLLNNEYCPFNDSVSNKNKEEDIVESYAELLFDKLDDSMDVFKPFNRVFVESKF